MTKNKKKNVPANALREKAKPKKDWKEPTFGAMPAADGKLPLSWRFSHRDMGGPFGWATVSDSELTDVLGKLVEFETKTWDQLHAARCHPMSISVLEKPARDRLTELDLDDYDNLMSFHLSGPKRIWCVADGNLMRVLWWDPDHQAYLTEVDRADRLKRKRRSA